MSEFDATKYKNDYQKNKYDRLVINVAKGQKEIIQAIAKSSGKSLNAFVIEAIREKIERDKSDSSGAENG